AGVGLEAQALDHVVPEHLQDRVQVRRVEGAVEAAERLHVGVEGVRRPVPGALKFLGRRGGGQRTADVHGGGPPALPFRALRDGDGEGRAGAVAVHGEGAVDAVEDLGGEQVGRLVQAEEGFAAGVGRVVAGQCGAPGRDGGGQFGGEVVVGGGGAAAVRHADQGQGGVVRGRGEGSQDRSPSGVVELPHAPGQPLGCGVLEDVDAPADGPGETDGLDGVAAEGEEVVVDGELCDGEGGPEGVEDDPLGGGGRRVVAAAGDHRVGQGTPVQLAVGREGDPVERR